MPKSIAKSCPLCLSVNDPVDMLPVVMEHSTPPQSAPLFLCRRCVLEVMKAAIGSEIIDPAEVFPNASAGADSAPDPGVNSSADPAVAALVPEDQPSGEDVGEHRRESEVPAGLRLLFCGHEATTSKRVTWCVACKRRRRVVR